jgi:perosamine synthetase
MIPVYKPSLNKEEIKEYLSQVIDSTWLTYAGDFFKITSEKLKKVLDVKHVLLCNNGSSATHLVALALKFKHPEITDIIIPNNVYIAAINAFIQDGNYICHSVDADINTWNYSLQELDYQYNKISNNGLKKVAILIVHNIGNIINVPKLQRKYPNAVFVVDNCEGFTGSHEGINSASIGLASSISGFGNKTITSGEFGVFCTNDTEVYHYIKCIWGQGMALSSLPLDDNGQEIQSLSFLLGKRYQHPVLGFNYRATNLQAAVIASQLNSLDEILSKKKRLFGLYRRYCRNLENILPQKIEEDTVHSHWMFGVRILGKKYKEIEKIFLNNGVECRQMFFPLSSSFTKDRKDVLLWKETVAQTLNEECVILPSFPDIADEEIFQVIKCLIEVNG